MVAVPFYINSGLLAVLMSGFEIFMLCHWASHGHHEARTAFLVARLRSECGELLGYPPLPPFDPPEVCEVQSAEDTCTLHASLRAAWKNEQSAAWRFPQACLLQGLESSCNPRSPVQGMRVSEVNTLDC